MNAPIAVVVAHLVGCAAAASVMEWRVGFEGTALWRFLLYPVSVPASMLLLPYCAWKSSRDRPDVGLRGWTVLATMSVLLWVTYLTGVAVAVIGLCLVSF